MALVVFIKSPDKLRRRDGTAIAIFEHISLMDSLKLIRDLLTDWRILVLLPCRSDISSKSRESAKFIVQPSVPAVPEKCIRLTPVQVSLPLKCSFLSRHQ